MPATIPQPLADFMANTLQPLKDADIAARKQVSVSTAAAQAAQQQLAQDQASQQQTDAELTQGWQQFLQIAAAYYAPGGDLPAAPAAPSPNTPPPSTAAA